MDWLEDVCQYRAVTGRIPGKGLATGYWGRNPRCNVKGWQLPEKITAMTRSQLQAMGRPALLYLPVQNGPSCTCNKDTSLSADRQCRSCYGVGLVPGFDLFLRDTLHFSSSEATGYTLTGTVIDTTLKPNRVRLVDTAMTGTVETTDVPFNNPEGAPWEADVQIYERPGSSHLVEISTDSGSTWTDLATWLGTTPPMSGVMRARITLSRINLDDESPEFEIVRLRHLREHHVSRVITALREGDDYSLGDILILRPSKMLNPGTDAARGGLIESPNQKAWTAPLDGFDLSIDPNTVPARIPTVPGDPHPFVELRYGLALGERYAMVNLNYSEETLVFTRQWWDERRVQPGEIWARVW